MKQILVFSALLIASQFALASGLTKEDTAVAWLQAASAEQAGLVTALGEIAGVSKKSDLRHLILCMRALAVEQEGKNAKIEDLFKVCLPQVRKPDGVSTAGHGPALVATAALEQARILHERVREKDPEAMYALAMLIGSEAPKEQAEYEASAWPAYGGRYGFGRHALLLEAAALENKDAAAYLCSVASDPGAPARYRANKDKWCSVQAR